MRLKAGLHTYVGTVSVPPRLSALLALKLVPVMIKLEASRKTAPFHRREEGAGGGGRAGGGVGWVCTQFVHGLVRMTICPRIATIPGRRTSGFHQTGRHCLHQARRAVRCSASRMKSELHTSKNRS